MPRCLRISIVALPLVVGQVPVAFAADMGVVTGSEKGTYYQFGVNL